MAGDLYLGCGRAAAEAGLWRAMLHRPVTRVVCWPAALPTPSAPGVRAWLQDNLDRLGLTCELDVWEDLRQHRPAELTTSDTDLLLVGGGNTFRLLDAVRTAGFVDAVRDFVGAGGDYYGGSAGAVLACESTALALDHDANDAGLTDLSGLGLLRGVAVLPHLTDDQLDRAGTWSRSRGVTVLGLPETSGVRCRGTTADVVGTGTVVEIADGAVRRHGPGQRFSVAR